MPIAITSPPAARALSAASVSELTAARRQAIARETASTLHDVVTRWLRWFSDMGPRRQPPLSVPHEGWGGMPAGQRAAGQRSICPAGPSAPVRFPPAGMPLDTYITTLFEHSYEHWFCHAHHFKWRATTVAHTSISPAV